MRGKEIGKTFLRKGSRQIIMQIPNEWLYLHVLPGAQRKQS